MTAEPLISAENVGIEFPSGQRALDGVDLRVARGEFISLVGPSGCGKSTLLRMIAGLMLPTKGTLAVAGRTPADRNSGGPRLPFGFQGPPLLP